MTHKAKATIPGKDLIAKLRASGTGEAKLQLLQTLLTEKPDAPADAMLAESRRRQLPIPEGTYAKADYLVANPDADPAKLPPLAAAPVPGTSWQDVERAEWERRRVEQRELAKTVDPSTSGSWAAMPPPMTPLAQQKAALDATPEGDRPETPEVPPRSYEGASIDPHPMAPPDTAAVEQPDEAEHETRRRGRHRG